MGRPDPQIRDAIVAHLRRHHPEICRHWFDDIEPIELAGGSLKMLVREPVQLNYLKRFGVTPFSEAAQAITGMLLAVQFVGEIEPREQIEDEAPINNNSKVAPAYTTSFVASSIVAGPAGDDMLISPDYSFENFIVGPGNRLAHAAALAVSQKPGRAYNPFFVHGGVGLGKTHILQAVCQTAMRQNPSLRVYFTSCDGFMNQFMDAVQAGHMADFRNRFRNVDLLVIDDIHDLASRDRTQEEFFHTFNTLQQAGKQIVLSSDAAPSEIPDLEERLVSRFNCGLVVRMEKPSFETRVAIVKRKAAMRNLDLPDDVSSYIAAKIDSNIRELEGAILKIHGLAALNEIKIDLDMAKMAIGEEPRRDGSQLPTIQDIIDTVSRYYDVKLTELLSKRRHKSIARPRQICMWLARKHTRYSLEEIGGYFGGRDHTTVMHAIRAIDSRREADPGLDHEVARLEQTLVGERD